MARAQVKPRAILLSKRAHVAYVEYARVLVKDDRVVYLTETGESVDQFFNIPYRNTALLLLGKGTSITDAAARKLAESQVIIGFCGSGGSPLLHAYFSPSWTAFQADRGRDFSVIVDGISN